MQSETSLFILSCDATGSRQGKYTGMSCFLEPYGKQPQVKHLLLEIYQSHLNHT